MATQNPAKRVRRSGNLTQSPQHIEPGFDIVAERAIVQEADTEIQAKKTRVASIFMERAIIKATVAELNRIIAEAQAKKEQALKNDLELGTEADGCKVAIKASQKEKEKAESYITLKEPFQLKKLPDELQVKILEMVFLRSDPKIPVNNFMDLANFVLHPILQTSSGVSGKAAEIFFGKHEFRLKYSAATYIFSGDKLPKIITLWLKDVGIEWPGPKIGGGSHLMYKSLLSCDKLQKLEFLIDFSKVKAANINALNKTMAIQKLLDSLPMSCQVTIIKKDIPGYGRGYFASDNVQERARVALQSAFDNRQPRVYAVSSAKEQKRLNRNALYRGPMGQKYRQNRKAKIQQVKSKVTRKSKGGDFIEHDTDSNADSDEESGDEGDSESGDEEYEALEGDEEEDGGEESEDEDGGAEVEEEADTGADAQEDVVEQGDDEAELASSELSDVDMEDFSDSEVFPANDASSNEVEFEDVVGAGLQTAE